MSFVSLEFIFIFLPLCVAGYYLCPGKYRNVFLLVASLVFYAAGDIGRMYILIISIIANYVFGLLIGREGMSKKIRSVILILAIGFNAVCLFGYKYLMILYGASNITMPLGLSYFTFRTVSYCLDVYWGMLPANKSVTDVALYVSFFPQISMGPISRYKDFYKDINERGFDPDSFFAGIKRIIRGLFRKLVIADALLPALSTCFGMEASERSVLFAWMGAIDYVIQLYYDFAGYSDIAIGLGQVFGFSLPENFNYPYASSSITEYWSRWHITLGAWTRDYIYTPIFRACQDKKIARLASYMLSSFAVWLFIGFWHGLGKDNMAVYILHGMYYFILIAGERMLTDYKKARRKKLGIKKKPQSAASIAMWHIYVIFVIIFGQVLFNCDSISQYGGYILSMFGGAGNAICQTEALFYLRQDVLPMIAGIIFSFPVVPYLVKMIKVSGRERLLQVLSLAAYILMLIVSFAFLFTNTYKSFVYFKF